MRPRIGGATARLIVAFSHDGESVSEATERLIRHPLGKDELMGTMEDWVFPNHLGGFDEIRPRLSDATAQTVEEAKREGEKNADVIDRLIARSDEWRGVDVDGFDADGHGKPYVESTKMFAAWYDRERPPTVHDVEAWLVSLSDGYQESTLRRHYHAVKAYFKYEIGDWDEPAPEPSRRELIDTLHDIAEDIGKTPTTRDVHERDGPPGVHHYQDEFETWNAALEAAGFEPNEASGKVLSDAELKEDLREFADEIGDIPTSGQMVRDGPHSTSTYITRFGSWSNALKEAGLRVEDRYGEIEA